MSNLFHFNILNQVAKEHGIVLFGSTSAANIPINELVQDYGINKNIYNRSIPGLTVMEAEKDLDSCIYSLKPQKIILNLGEEDMLAGSDLTKVIDQYRWILYKIHTVLPKATLILVSIANNVEHADEFNQALHALADECGCEYIDIPQASDSPEYDIRFFRMIKSAFYEADMSYSDIVQYCTI